MNPSQKAKLVALQKSPSDLDATVGFINYYLKKQKKEDRLIGYIRNNIIGKDACFSGNIAVKIIPRTIWYSTDHLCRLYSKWEESHIY